LVLVAHASACVLLTLARAKIKITQAEARATKIKTHWLFIPEKGTVD
jgi:hypothetical protein